jgi:hypothetical protein
LDATKVTVTTRVARWFLFKPKITILENIGGSLIVKCLYILWPFGIFYGHLVYFMTAWYIFCSFGTFFPVLVSRNKKIWQPWSPRLLIVGKPI